MHRRLNRGHRRAGSAGSGGGRWTLAGTHPAWAVPGRMVARPGRRRPASPPASTWPGVTRPAWPLTRRACPTRPARSTGKFLTSRQELQRFGPSAAQVAAVRGWLSLGRPASHGRHPALRQRDRRRPGRAGSVRDPAGQVSRPRRRGRPGAGRGTERARRGPRRRADRYRAGHRTGHHAARPGRPAARPRHARAGTVGFLYRAAVLRLLRPAHGDRQARGLRQARPVGRLRLHPGAAAQRLRADRQLGHRQGRHRGGRRRLRLAHDRRRRPHLRRAEKFPGARDPSSGSRTPPSSTTSPSAISPAGRRRSHWTSRPCTRWPPARISSTSGPPTARSGR